MFISKRKLKEMLQRARREEWNKAYHIGHLDGAMDLKRKIDKLVVTRPEGFKRTMEDFFGLEYFIIKKTHKGQEVQKIYLNESISFSWRDLPENGKLTFSVKSDGVWYPEYLLFKTEEEALKHAITTGGSVAFNKLLPKVLKEYKAPF